MNWSDRLRTLQYYTASGSGIINKPTIAGKQIDILIDKKPIDNISAVAVSLFNTSDKDYADVPLEVVFTPANGRQPLLIQANIKTPTEFYDAMSLPDAGDGTVRYGYRFHVVNRSPNNNAFLEATYFFEGDQAPSISVVSMKEGLIAQRAEISKTQQHSSIPWYVAVIVSILFVVAFAVSMAAVSQIATTRDVISARLHDDEKLLTELAQPEPNIRKIRTIIIQGHDITKSLRGR